MNARFQKWAARRMVDEKHELAAYTMELGYLQQQTFKAPHEPHRGVNGIYLTLSILRPIPPESGVCSFTYYARLPCTDRPRPVPNRIMQRGAKYRSSKEGDIGLELG
jgi:hypothetical protein